MPLTRAHPMFDHYRRETLTPVRTLAEAIVARTGAAMRARMMRELDEAIKSRDPRRIEQALDELDVLERQIAALPALARESRTSRIGGSERPQPAHREPAAHRGQSDDAAEHPRHGRETDQDEEAEAAGR